MKEPVETTTIVYGVQRESVGSVGSVLSVERINFVMNSNLMSDKVSLPFENSAALRTF